MTKEKLPAYLINIVIASLLVIAAYAKALDGSNFILLFTSELGWTHQVASSFLVLVGCLELVAANLLLFKWELKNTYFMAIILFTAFLLTQIYILTTGITQSCGCLGGMLQESSRSIDIARNSIILVMLLYAKVKLTSE